jgi:hypothetical protein
MIVPVSLTGKYQLFILGDSNDTVVAEWSARCISAVRQAIDALGVNSKKFLVSAGPGSPAGTLDPKMPTVAIYCGLTPTTKFAADDETFLSQLTANGYLVIPVVNTLDSYRSFVPTILENLNGVAVADCGADCERIAARILEGFGLLRERRRLFISYRRLDASGIAAQLYEALDIAGYDVFLDTHGAIKPGEPFQEILWHRLADTDVVVLLDTPNFLGSRWTEEELARANNSSLQILQLLWPDQPEVSSAAFSSFYPLSNADFSSSDTLGPAAHLKDEQVVQIVDSVEGLRARALSARHNFLVREFLQEARNEGLTTHTTLERNLVLLGPGGARTLVVPAIGIPDSERYQNIADITRRDAGIGISYTDAPVLLFDQTGIRSRWLSHLNWLNDNLPCAKSISLQDARKWLTALSAVPK